MTTWHAPPTALVQYAQAPELVDELTATSIEQHLLACDTCRSVVAAAVDGPALAASWEAVVDVIDRPRATVLERILHRVGVPTELSRIVAATPGLRLAWLTTTILLAAGAVAIARSSGAASFFLGVAPLLPLGSVLIVFLPADEPGGEAAAATPLFGAGLLLRRVVAVTGPTFAVVAVAGRFQPDLPAGGALWLLPGLALALGSLALATWLRPVVATTVLAAGWVALLVVVRALEGSSTALADTALFQARGQWATCALAVAAAGFLYGRRDRLSTVEVPW